MTNFRRATAQAHSKLADLLQIFGIAIALINPQWLLYALGNALACCNFSDSALIVLFGVS